LEVAKLSEIYMKNRINTQAMFLIEMILDDYSNWLHKKGYIDTDYYCEEPTAVKEYLKTNLCMNQTKKD